MKSFLFFLFIQSYKFLVIIKNFLFPNIKIKSKILHNITCQLMSLKLNKVKTKLGTTLVLDRNDSLNLSFNKIYELNVVEYLNRILKKDFNVIDIGANIGYYTTYFSNKSSMGKIFAFEPEIENLNILYKNIDINNCKNVKVFANSVGEEDKDSYLYLSQDNTGDHRCYDVSNDKRLTQKIIQVKLDNIDFSVKIDLIKIDIQGFEYSAIKGMSQLIKRDRPIVISEFWPNAIKSNGDNPIDILHFFNDLGYSVVNLENSKRIGVNEFNMISKSHKNDLNLLFSFS